MVVDVHWILNHFLHTPSEIRTSICAIAQFHAAKCYAQCRFKQNKQYSVRGVMNTKFVNGNEGGNNKNM